MGTAALGAVCRRANACLRALQQVLQFQGLHQVGIPHQGTVGRAYPVERPVDGIHFRDAFSQYFPAAEHGRIGLHGALHAVAYFSGARVAAGITSAVEARQGSFGGGSAQGLVRGAGFDFPGGAQGRGAAEYDQVEQAVRTQAVGAVHRNAGRLADGHEAGNDTVEVAVLQRNHLAVVIGRDTAHVVMHRGEDGDGRPADVHPGEDAG